MAAGIRKGPTALSAVSPTGLGGMFAERAA
jgi:hypothetical protein